MVRFRWRSNFLAPGHGRLGGREVNREIGIGEDGREGGIG